jgi:hypothetical protein
MLDNGLMAAARWLAEAEKLQRAEEEANEKWVRTVSRSS